MKYTTGIVTTITLFAVCALSGCDSSSKKMERAETSVVEANRDLEIAKSEVEAELRNYRAKHEERVMEFNRTINEIERSIENESDEEVRDRLEDQLEELEETKRELQREMDNYKASGRENWDNFKDSFSDRMDDLGDSLKNFFSTSNTTPSTN